MSDEAAFPVVHPDGSGVQYFGMSLRDYFAAKALPIAWDAFDRGYYDAGGDESNAAIAACAYQMADAMLAERAK